MLTVQCTNHHRDQSIASLVQTHFPPQNPAKINVDVFSHGRYCLRIRGCLNRRYDRIADNISLSRSEDVYDGAGGSNESDHLCRRGR